VWIRGSKTAALGDQSRRGEWVVFFQREIAETGWQAVLREYALNPQPVYLHAARHVIENLHNV